MKSYAGKNKGKTLHAGKAPETKAAQADKRLNQDADKAAEKASQTQQKFDQQQGIFTK